MPQVVKRAPAKKSEGRIAITIRLSRGALKGIERQAAKQKMGSRELMRVLLEEKFDPQIAPQISL